MVCFFKQGQVCLILADSEVLASFRKSGSLQSREGMRLVRT